MRAGLITRTEWVRFPPLLPTWWTKRVPGRSRARVRPRASPSVGSRPAFVPSISGRALTPRALRCTRAGCRGATSEGTRVRAPDPRRRDDDAAAARRLLGRVRPQPRPPGADRVAAGVRRSPAGARAPAQELHRARLG